MRLTIVGSGDAFGSGGRLQTCYHVDPGGTPFLIDCGATAMIGLNRLGIDPNGIETIFISHLHGDHFAGLVWFMLHAQHVAKRVSPLTVVGPPTIESRYLTASEALFANSTKVARKHDLRFVEIVAGSTTDIGGVRVTPFLVEHPSGAPSYALRFELGGKVLSFSGDTEWTETLVPAGAGADLYLVECYKFDTAPKVHMSWEIIRQNLPRLDARHIVLTHMSDSMLARRGEVSDPRVSMAEDGRVVEF